ncbi:hypothetical protein EIP91_012172 [Steccherinum ochraceum]|uniref:Protein kinase domain-containing protein n=1 Tax=Steccherinum ochraceum TaxID=92696 RepID=A0A4R0RKK3_9APHY|nr:hypothetical protein EIP91_012172 [Steccherinum ochraceum]
MPAIARQLFGAATGGVSLVADVVGVPGLGAATELLSGINDQCEKVASHKREAKRMARKASSLITVLESHVSDMEQSQLRDYAHDVLHTLHKVNSRMKTVASYKRMFAWMTDSRVSEGIRQCEADIDVALETFNMGSNFVLDRSQTEIKEMVASGQAEIRTLLINFLRNPANVERIAEMERQGEGVALPIMNAGQHQLSLVAQELAAEKEAAMPDTSDSEDEEDIPPEIPYPKAYLETQRGLAQLHSLTGILPTVRVLDGMVQKEDSLPVAGGMFSDVFLGWWLGDKKVALKALRNIRSHKIHEKPEVAKKIEKRFEAQVNLWSRLEHKNILKFLGILTEKNFVHMVSPWQENGNILLYTKNNPDADRLRLVRGAANGLAYLHSEKIMHGNLKCTNILVSIEGEACISDFGMSRIIEDVTEQTVSAILTSTGSARWLAPELIMTETAPFTLACDTYSFAMTILECLTNQSPFASLKRDAQVIHRLMTDRLPPERPQTEDSVKWISDELWVLMIECWSYQPEDRPLMQDVAKRLEEMDGETKVEVVDDAMDVDETES